MQLTSWLYNHALVEVGDVRNCSVNMYRNWMGDDIIRSLCNLQLLYSCLHPIEHISSNTLLFVLHGLTLCWMTESQGRQIKKYKRGLATKRTTSPCQNKSWLKKNNVPVPVPFLWGYMTMKWFMECEALKEAAFFSSPLVRVT